MSTAEAFDIDRDTSIEKNVDAFGRQWEVRHIRGSNLYQAASAQWREGSTLPDLLAGRWSKKSALEQRIHQHVTDSWDYADKKATQAKRKEHAKKAEAKEKSGTASE